MARKRKKTRKKPAADRPLSARQQAFVREYVSGKSAKDAYIAAGYEARDNAAESAAARLLRNVQVQEAIAVAREKLQEKSEITLEKLLAENALLAFSDIGQILDFSRTDPHLRPANEIPESARRAIQSVKVRRYTEGHGDNAREVELTEFRLWSKSDALKEIAKLLGLYKPTKHALTDPSGDKPYDPTQSLLERLAQIRLPERSAGGPGGIPESAGGGEGSSPGEAEHEADA